MYDFTKYCGKPIKNSVYCGPVNKEELIKKIKCLKNSKLPGPDDTGPKLITQVQHAPTIIVHSSVVDHKDLCQLLFSSMDMGTFVDLVNKAAVVSA